MSETPVHFLAHRQEDAPIPLAEFPPPNHDVALGDHPNVPDLPEDTHASPEPDPLLDINIPVEDISDDAAPSDLIDFTTSHALLPEEVAELAWLAETRRFIILRLQEWVIPVSALICVLLAVLLEAGLVAIAWWLVMWHPISGGGSRGQGAGAATAIGGIIQSTGLNLTSANPATRWRPGPMPAPPDLPDKPIFTPHTQALALLDNTNPFHAALPIIGIKSDHNTWAAPANQLAPKTLRIKITRHHTPGQQTRSRGPQVASRGAQPDAPGGGGGNGLIQLFKPGSRTGLGSATGTGPGRGRGAGVGGGGSIVVPPPNPILPLKYEFALPAHLVNPKFELTIRRNGTVAAVKVLISSGHVGIDQAIINALMQARFLPNIISGKPVQSKFVIRYQLTS